MSHHNKPAIEKLTINGVNEESVRDNTMSATKWAETFPQSGISVGAIAPITFHTNSNIFALSLGGLSSYPESDNNEVKPE